MKWGQLRLLKGEMIFEFCEKFEDYIRELEILGAVIDEFQKYDVFFTAVGTTYPNAYNRALILGEYPKVKYEDLKLMLLQDGAHAIGSFDRAPKALAAQQRSSEQQQHQSR